MKSALLCDQARVFIFVQPSLELVLAWHLRLYIKTRLNLHMHRFRNLDKALN